MRKLYFSTEFFAGLKGYKMVDAEMNADITSQAVYDTLTNKDWTSYGYSGNPVLNIAIGYSWTLKNDLFSSSGTNSIFWILIEPASISPLYLEENPFS